MQRNNYLEQIIESAKKYQSQLLNRVILFVYQNPTDVEYIEVKFEKGNFKHLIGVETKLKPTNFFENCINRQLGINSFRVTSNTPVKLSVFNTLVHLPNIPATIGEFDGTNPKLEFDIAIAKHEMVLGVIKTQDHYYAPLTLLKAGNHFNYMKSQHPILMTFTKSIGTEVAQYIPSYINAKCDANKVISKLPKHIQETCELG